MSAAAEPDPIPGAPPVSIEQARAAVAGWRQPGAVLFGLHQIGIALDDEIEQLRREQAADQELARREVAAWQSAYHTAKAETEWMREATAGLIPAPVRQDDPEATKCVSERAK